MSLDLSRGFDGAICSHFHRLQRRLHDAGGRHRRRNRRQVLEVLGGRSGVEGQQNGVWVAMDYVDVVVHIFQTTELRGFYKLRELWPTRR